MPRPGYGSEYNSAQALGVQDVELPILGRYGHAGLNEELDACLARHRAELQYLLRRCVASSTADSDTVDAETLKAAPQVSSTEEKQATSEALLREEPHHHLELQGKAEDAAAAAGATHENFSHRRTKLQVLKATKAVAGEPTRFEDNVCSDLVRSPWFDRISSTVILCSAILVGAEVEYAATTRSSANPLIFDVLQIVFAFVFTAELVVRFFSRCSRFWTGPERLWNFFDLFCVTTSLVEVFMVFVLNAKGSLLFIARALRIIRMARIIRMITILRELRMMVSTVLNAVQNLFSILILLTLIIYVFSICLTQAATAFLMDSGGEEEQRIKLFDYFGTIGNSMFTLFMAISGGISWGDHAEQLTKVGWPLAAIFLFYISLTMFILLNVITGFCCENAINSAKSDRESVIQDQIASKERYVKQFSAIFANLDATHSGELSYEQLAAHIEDEEMQAYFASLDISMASAWDIFELLDDDGSGTVTVEEFTLGCMQLRGHATAIDLAKVMSHLSKIQETLDQRFTKWTSCADI